MNNQLSILNLKYDILLESLEIDMYNNECLLGLDILTESNNGETIVGKRRNIIKDFIKLIMEKIGKLIEFIRSKFTKDKMDVIKNVSKEDPKAVIHVSRDPNIVIKAANESIKEIEDTMQKHKRGIFEKEDGSKDVSKMVYVGIGAAAATTIAIIAVPKLVNTIQGLLSKLKNLGNDVMTNIVQDENDINKAKSKGKVKTSIASKAVYNVGKGVGKGLGGTISATLKTAANKGFAPTINLNLNFGGDPKIEAERLRAQNEVAKAINNTTRVLENSLNKDLLNNPDINKASNDISKEKTSVEDKKGE